MNTPITKRIKQSYSKKESIAKQTLLVDPSTSSLNDIVVKQVEKEKGRYTKDGEVYEYNALLTPGAQAPGVIVTEAEKGGPLETDYLKHYKNLSKRFLGATGAELEAKGHLGKGKGAEFDKLYPSKANSGSLEIQDNPVILEPKPGTTIDTSTAYGVRQIGRGQKKSSKDVRRGTIKLSKFADIKYKDDGSIDFKNISPKENLSARQRAKFDERMSELKSMSNTQKRISDMASSGVDPQITLRYEYGRGMEKGQEGGPLTDPTGKYEKEEETKARLSKRILGTSDSNVISKGYSTGKGMPKKQATPILMKKGMKMSGFGSKTYKK